MRRPAAAQFDAEQSTEVSRPSRLPPQVLLLGLASLLNDTASEIIYPLLPLFLTATLGATPLAVGLIEGAADGLSSILKWWSGRMSDRWGTRKPLVVGGYALAAISRIFVATAGRWSAVLGARLMDRTGKGIRSAPRDALIADVTDPSMRGRAFGLHRALDHSGAVLGPLLAMLMLSWQLSLRQIFWIAVVPGILAALLLLFFLTDVHQSRTNTQKLSLDASPALRRPLAAIALFSLANSSDAFLLLHAHNAGVTPLMLPMLWAAHHAVKAALSAYAGSLSDRVGRRDVLIAAWLIYALIYALFPFARSLTGFVALFVVYAIPFALSEGTERAWIADLVSPGARGTTFGVYYLVSGAGVFTGSLLFGLIYQSAAPSFAFAFGSALAGAAALALLAMPRRAHS